jgi:hypothetical protein
VLRWIRLFGGKNIPKEERGLSVQVYRTPVLGCETQPSRGISDFPLGPQHVALIMNQVVRQWKTEHSGTLKKLLPIRLQRRTPVNHFIAILPGGEQVGSERRVALWLVVRAQHERFQMALDIRAD